MAALPPNTRPVSPTGQPLAPTPLPPPVAPPAPTLQSPPRTAGVTPRPAPTAPPAPTTPPSPAPAPTYNPGQLDATAFTNPHLQRIHAPQARQQQQQATHLEQDTARQQREAEKAAQDAADRAKRDANNAAESTFRQTNRPFYTDADGNIRPTQDDATFAQQQQETAQDAQRQVEWKKQGRTTWKNPATGKVEPIEDDATFARKQQEAATKRAADLRQKVIDDELDKTTLAASDPARAPLPGKARTALEKEIKTTEEAARAALITRHSTTAKDVTGGADWIPFNESPTQGATSSKERLAALQSGFDSNLSDQDLADLEADPATAPAAAKLRTLRARIQTDDENATWQQTQSEKAFDLKLKKANPEEWARRRETRLASLSPADHAKALEAEAGDFTTRLTEHQQQAAPLIAAQQQFTQQLTDLETQAADARMKGIPAGEIVTLNGPDGPQDWPQALAETYLRTQQQGETWQSENQDTLDLIQTRQSELQVEQEALVTSQAQAQEKAKAQRQTDLQRLTQSPITRTLGEGLMALDTEAEQRRAALTAKFPDPNTPQAKEALAALEADLQTKTTALQEDATFRQTTAQQAYAGVKERIAADPQNPNIGQHFVEARQNLVDLLGITPKEADTILDDQHKGDWTHSAGDSTSFIQKGEGSLLSGWKVSPDDQIKEPYRVLSDGSLSMNPKLLHDEERYKKAVEAATASPSAKAAALESLPDQRAQLGKEALEAFQAYAPAKAAFDKFISATPEISKLDPEQQALAFADKMRADSGPVGRLLDQVVRRLATGTMSVGSQALGLIGGITGSETALKGAGAIDDYVGASNRMLDFTGANDSVVNRIAGETAGIAGSLIPSMVGGFVARGAAALFFRTALGSRYLLSTAAAVKGLKAAKTAADAQKAIQTAQAASLTSAGVAGAAAAGAGQTYGAQISEIYGTLRDNGMGHQDALRAAQVPALLSASVTAIMTLGMGATGVEKLLKAPDAAKEQVKKTFGQMAKGFVTEGSKELVEEIPDELFSHVFTSLSTDPTATIPEVVGQFLETLPELAGATALLGGGGSVLSDVRSNRAAPKTSPEASATAPQGPDTTKLPEVIAAARAAIANYQPAAGSPLTPQAAAAVLEIAQGSFSKLTTSQLNALGWTRENGKLKPLKDYAGPPALEFVDKEQTIPILRQEILDEVDSALPELGDTIAMDEAEAREFFQQKQQQPNATAPTEAPAPGLATNVGGAAAPATASAAPPAEAAPPPATTGPAPVDSKASPTSDQLTPMAAERTEQITNHLTSLGLDQTAAEKVAAHMVRVQGVVGEDYRFNVVADSFKAELKKLGISGALTRVGAKDNPLKAPADLDARLSQAAPEVAVAPPANAPAVEATSEPRGSSAQGAAAPAVSGEDTPQGGAEASRAKAPPATPSRHSPNSRAGKLAALLVANGSYTQQEADDALDDYMAARPRGTEKMTVIEEKKPLLKFLANRENQQNGGKLKRAQATTPPTKGPVMDGGKNGTWEEAKADAVAAQPVGSRRRARRALAAMDEVLKIYGNAFERVEFNQNAKRILDGNAIAVTGNIGGDIVLIIDPEEFAKQHSWSPTSRLLSADTIIEEVIHAIVRRLGKTDPKFTDKAVGALWDDLTPELRQLVWDSYRSRFLSDNPDFPRTPATDLPSLEKIELGHEMLRMTVQKKGFRKRLTEQYGIDPRGLLPRIAALLRRLADALTEAIGRAPKPLQTRLEDYTTEILKAAEALTTAPVVKDSLTTASTVKESLTVAPSTKSAVTTEDNRAPVVIAGSPAPTAKGPASLVTGSTGTAYTDTNDAIEYDWAIVETAELTISNRDDGTVDPAYPQELQPRDRTSAGSEAQVQDIAKNANLDRLSATNTVGDGAPIIGPDGVVESGNGRTMGIRRAYTRGLPSAANYKRRLETSARSFGLTPEAVAKMQAPMLVRVRRTNVDRIAFVMAANVSTIAPKREIEQAKTDAKQIVPDLFETFVATDEGDIFTAANAEFIRGFIAAVVPPAERPAIYDAKGFLSQAGLRRLRNALFVYAYGDSKSTLNALARLTEDIEADGRNLVNALVALAPRFGEQNARIEAGALRPLSITADLAESLAAYQGLKERGETVENWAAQATLPGVDDGPTDLQKALVTGLHEHRRSAWKLIAVLNRYAAGVDGLGDPKQASLFGDEPTPTTLELWDIASKTEPSVPLATATKTPPISNLQSSISGASRPIAPNNALKLYRKLKQIERDRGSLDGTQSQTLRRAEAALGQTFFPFTETSTPQNFSLETETQATETTSASINPPDSEQLRLFMAPKISFLRLAKPAESGIFQSESDSANSFRNPANAAQLVQGQVPGGNQPPSDGERGENGSDPRRSGESAGVVPQGITALPELDPSAWASGISRIPQTDRFNGQEHYVFRDRLSNRAIKITNPGEYGARQSLGGYLRQMQLMNEMFGDGITVEGWLQGPGETGTRLITSQPWIQGANSTLEEIDTYMRRKSFLRMYDGAWWHSSLEMLATDALPKNFITDDTGHVHPIDMILAWPLLRAHERIENIVNSQPQPSPSPEPPPLAMAQKTSPVALQLAQDTAIANNGSGRRLTGPEAAGQPRALRVGGTARRQFLPAVWQMLQDTYAAIGHQYNQADELLSETTLWDVFINPETGKPNAFNIAKATPYGYKATAFGSDGSPTGKLTVRAIIARFNEPAYWAELSDAPAYIANKNGVPRVPALEAAALLGKDIIPQADGFTYERWITGLPEPHIKAIFGKPWTPTKPSLSRSASQTSNAAGTPPQTPPNGRNSQTPSQASDSPTSSPPLPLRTTQRLLPSDTFTTLGLPLFEGFGFTTLLTPAQQEAKFQQAEQLDLFGNAPTSPSRLESDRRRDRSGNRSRPSDFLPGERGGPNRGDGELVSGGSQSGDLTRDSRQPSGSASTDDGTRSPDSVSPDTPGVSDSPTGSPGRPRRSRTDEQRAAVESGAELDLFGTPPVRPATDTVAAERETPRTERLKLQTYVTPDSSPWKDFKPADAASIARSVPILLPAQQTDVLKAERRFLIEKPTPEDPKRGILFTNGTGTGKTFSGLGILKRMMMRGASRALIVVPSQPMVAKWQTEAGMLQIDTQTLSSTEDAGEGVVVTTYANFRANWKLQSEPWDLIIYDEAHYLNSNAAGTDTANVAAHFISAARTPQEARRRAAQRVIGRARPGYGAANSELQDAWDREAEEKTKQITAAQQTDPETQVVFLSATPFAYHKSLSYADGFLYNAPRKSDSTGYNIPQGFDRYLVENFGYSMRNNRLNQPAAEVDTGLMEREWSERMFRAGAMSGRMIDVPFDYSREFIVLDSTLGKELDRGFAELTWGPRNESREESTRWRPLREAFRSFWYSSAGGYTRRMQLLESIKIAGAVERMNQHLELGREIVLFHTYNNADPVHPFANLDYLSLSPAARTLAQEWIQSNPDLTTLDFDGLYNPRQLIRAAFPDALFFNGEVSKADRVKAIKSFNDAAHPARVIMVQMDAGKEGISLHDTTGRFQRVLMNAALPVKPTDAIQTEGRIYRIGVQTNAIQEYLTLHTNMERSAFGSKISQRTGTVENMALGKMARALKDSFKSGYLNAHGAAPSTDQGLGGKAQDQAEFIGTDLDRAKSYFYGRMKKTSRTKAAEGVDYFATPEPIGMVMSSWLLATPGMDLLEPSAGHGAIARFFPDTTNNRFIEPSTILADELRIKVESGKVLVQTFEDLNEAANRFHGIAMNPPFGQGGKTAIEHLAKAARHLRNGGRIVALIPEGPAADKRFNDFMASPAAAALHLRASYGLPTVTFERAGTAVKTRLVILDKADLWTIQSNDQGRYYAVNAAGDRVTAYAPDPANVRRLADYDSSFFGFEGDITIRTEAPEQIEVTEINDLFARLDEIDPPALLEKATPAMPLAMARKVGDTSPNDRPSLDPTTGAPTRILGSRLTPEQGQAVGHGIASRLKNALREGAPGTPAFDWQSPGLPRRLASAFGVPILTDDQEARLRALPVNTDGIESTVYLDRTNGVVYKRLATGTNEPSLGIWPETGWTPDRKLEWHYQQADRPRHLAIRLAVMTALGGTPTEIHAIGPAGHVYLKQPLSPNPGIGRDPNAIDNNALTIARRRAGIVELPSGLLPASSPRAFVTAVNGRPWLLTDLYPDNFIADNQDNARVNDPVVGQITPDLLSKVAGLGAVVKQAIQEEKRLGDRSARLFMANKVAPTPDDGNLPNDDLRNRPTSDARTDSPNSPGFIARNVLGADRRQYSQKPPSQTLQGNRAAIAAEYRRLLDWAREKGLIFNPDRLGRERDSRGEHRIYEPADNSTRVFKVTHPGLSGLTRRALVLRDGSLRVMEDDALPSEYLDRWELHNEILNDDAQFEGILESSNGPSIVTSQRHIEGSHPTTAPDLTQAGWQQHQGYWSKPHPSDPSLIIGLADTKPSNWIQDKQTGAILSVDTIPFIVTQAMQDASPLFASKKTIKGRILDAADAAASFIVSAEQAVGLESPLQKLGLNHLDKSLSSKLAAHTRWMNEKTGVGETVAAWLQTENVKKVTNFAKIFQRELFPDSVLPREITARIREMNVKSAMGAQRAMDLTRALSGTPKFSDIVYPPGFAENPLHRRHLYEAMAGMRDMTTLAPELQTLAKRLRSMLVQIGTEAVKQGRMSLDTFEGLRENYMPHFYEEDVAREKSFLKRFVLGVRDIFAQRTTAWHIVDLQTKDKTGEPRLVSYEGNRWRFKNKEHRDAFFEDFIAKESLDRLQSRDKRWRSLTLEDLNKRSALPDEARGRLQEIENALRAQFRKEKPLSLSEQEKAGLILDPVYSIARYAAQMVHDNSTAEFFNFVASKPEWISDTATPGFTQIPDSTAFGRLAGKYVENDIHRQLTELVETPNAALRFYDTVMSWWKAGKTLYNPATHLRNVMSNVFFGQLAGVNPLNPGNLRYYRDAIRHLRNGGQTLTEAYEDGVLGADYVSAELRQTLRQLLPDPATIEESAKGESILLGLGKAIGQVVPNWAKNPLHKFHNTVTGLYQLEDEVYKLAAYLKSLEMGETREAATAHVRKWFPYYDTATSTTIKGLQRTVWPFLSFYRESVRIFGVALKERPLSLAAGMALPSLITLFSAMALGLDDDDLEQIRKDARGKAGKLLGPTPLGGIPLFSMLLPVKSGTGLYQQWDLSGVFPFTDLLGNRVETDETEDWWQQSWRSFLAAGPIGSLVYAQVTGRESFGDRPFVEANMTTGEKFAARLDNLAKTALPPLTPFYGTSFESIANSGEVAPNKSLEFRSPGQAVMRALFGVDVRNATPKVYRMVEDYRKANNLPTTEGMDFGSTTPTSRARTELFKQIAQPEPNLAAIKNLSLFLEKQGSPVRTADDIRKLLFYRDPLMIIRGKENQQRFRASLTGLERETFENALSTFKQIEQRAPGILMQALATP